MIELQTTVSTDSVRAVLDDVFSAARYEWQVRPDPWRWLRNLFSDLVGRLLRLETEHPVIYYALIAGLTVLLVVILVHMGYLVWLAFRARERKVGEWAETAREVRDAAWHMRRARELEAQGAYAESLAHRFAALVALLDQRQVLRAHPSKTPGEYLREARLDQSGRAAFAEVVHRMYDHLFGGRPVDPEGLAEFDRGADEVAAHGPA